MKTRNQLLALFILGGCLIIVLFSYFILTGFSIRENPSTIKVGAILPLSGKSAEWGEKTFKGMELAQNELNKERPLISIIYEDSEGDIKKAVTAVNKLIYIDKVDALTCQLSDICSAIAPVAQKNRIPLLGFTNAPNFTDIGQYIFNLRGESPEAGKVLGNFAAERYKKVAVFYLDNPTLKGVYTGFKEAFEAKGNSIVFVSYHYEKDSDFKTELQKAKSKNPDALLFSSRPANAAILVRQARELGLNQPIIGTLGIDTKSFIDGLGNLSDGIVYPTAVIDYSPDNQKLHNALVEYERLYGEQMPAWTAEGYDTILLLGNFAHQSASSSEDIQNHLVSIKGFIGLTGNYVFDKFRVIQRKYVIYKINQGNFVPF